MAASEAAVTAVMEALGCTEFESVQDGEHYCRKHRHLWLAWGCQDAAIAARAAVDADRASIQAETAKAVTVALADLIEPFSGIGLANGATRGDVARWLRDRADRIEAQP